MGEVGSVADEAPGEREPGDHVLLDATVSERFRRALAGLVDSARQRRAA